MNRTTRSFVRLAWLGLAMFLSVASHAGVAHAAIRVVASITDLASIASSVGGEQVEAASIARANADPHRVEVLPSYMVRVSRAELYLKVGLGLDMWADPIVDGSRNAGLIVVDCSQGVLVLEKAAGKVDASMGDVHPDGNPHYWLDPRNGGVVARNIAAALARVDPGRASEYAARAEEFARAADAKAAEGVEMAAALRTRDIVTYHRSWSYLAHALGLDVVATVEPIPGIPTTGRHLNDLVNVIRERKIALVMEEPYFSEDAAEFLSRETGVTVARVSASCDDAAAGSYLAHFDALYGILAGASARTGNAGAARAAGTR